MAIYISCITALGGVSVLRQRLKSGAVVKLQAGRTRSAAHQFCARHQIGAAGTGDGIAGACEFLIGHTRVAAQISRGKTLQRVECVALPVGRRRLAAASG
ncbi:hypothetical protein [Collimonas silvisoli]|uniref:hypothetical protein n=1 Tax=Collimonas silvisoli TaxID=2825884 RepID=UPI001B8B7394|nr:hypothetical protein [Collimonas silvisoli]